MEAEVEWNDSGNHVLLPPVAQNVHIGGVDRSDKCVVDTVYDIHK
jgi:hypothetical protein